MMPRDTRPTSVELFSGCGGLAMGISEAGFRHLVLVERDHDAYETVAYNAALGVRHVKEWNYVKADVRTLDWTVHAGADIVAGGPPCQPFGIGGKSRGHEDERDMWPEAVRAVREIAPKAFAFENVFGMLRPAFSGYVAWVKACLERPDMPRLPGETHAQHLVRLSSSDRPALYRVHIESVNAANFGAPQNRRRVLFLGVRADLGSMPAPPQRTHSRERLLWDQYVDFSYWKRHQLSPKGREPLLKADASTVAKLKASGVRPSLEPWVTVRDALRDLIEETTGLNGHVYQPGARVYPGHTGSPLDLPAKALKAGDHGVPGGENMMVKDDGTVRYFTMREAARLMGLPESYQFPRSWTESMRQVGNAVPVQLGTAVGRWLASAVAEKKGRSRRAA